MDCGPLLEFTTGFLWHEMQPGSVYGATVKPFYSARIVAITIAREPAR
jgi:hypothetical protein